MQIKNWQTFSNVSLECKNFLVFIGESSTGKSSFMKALLYFFQARNLHKGDIKNPELPLEIIGTLKGEKGHIFQLRILNNPYQDTRYFIKNHISKHEKDNRNWEEIEEKDKAIVGDFENMFKWGYAKEVPMEVIKYGDPDNTGKDLKGYNQVYLRAETYIGWGIFAPSHFARIKEA